MRVAPPICPEPRTKASFGAVRAGTEFARSLGRSCAIRVFLEHMQAERSPTSTLKEIEVEVPV